MNDSALQHLSYEDLRRRADDFLNTYHPERSLPIPIEEIIEFKMGLGIDLIHGLKGILAEAEIEGFLYGNLKSIAIDLDIYEEVYVRARFTMAHELGHLVLHRDMYSQYGAIDKIEQRLQFMRSIPEQSYWWFEWQAKAFAGLVLVPGDLLKEIVAQNVELVQKTGIRLKGPNDPNWDYICEGVKRPFDVSSQVVDIRMNNDGLKEVKY